MDLTIAKSMTLPIKSTARELLASLDPSHDLHTVTAKEVRLTGFVSRVSCSCGSSLPFLVRNMLDMDAVKHALRNVPEMAVV